MEFLRRLLIDNWDRKLVSLVIAVSLWLLVNQSLTTTKTLDHIVVRLINIPEGRTVDGLLPSNMLSSRISLTLQGNKNYLKELTSNDLEVVLDATDKSDEWIAAISSKNLVSLNPDIDLAKAIKRVMVQRLPIVFTKLVTEKIPIIVTHPIGEAPRDYQFLDVYPYRLFITVSGPEEKIKQVKAKGINLTFNLNNITRDDLDEADTLSDEISFMIPNSWKEIILPSISDRPLVIDDPQAQDLHIDFVKSDFHPLVKPIPIALFFPTEHSHYLNPEIYSIIAKGPVEKVHGIFMIRTPLFAKGASRLFVELVQEMLQISILVHPNERKLDWCIQFQNHRVLEDKYVSILLSDKELRYEDPNFSKQQEEYLRNRFRSYMNRFQVFKSQAEKLDLSVELDHQHICIQDISHEKTSLY